MPLGGMKWFLKELMIWVRGFTEKVGLERLREENERKKETNKEREKFYLHIKPTSIFVQIMVLVENGKNL